MECPKCKKENWRANISQSVDIEIDEDFYPTDNGMDFTDVELDKESVFCDSCGFEPHKKGDDKK